MDVMHVFQHKQNSAVGYNYMLSMFFLLSITLWAPNRVCMFIVPDGASQQARSSKLSCCFYEGKSISLISPVFPVLEGLVKGFPEDKYAK